MLPKITEPSGVEVMLSGNILSPLMVISAGGEAACAAAAAPMKPVTARRRNDCLDFMGSRILRCRLVRIGNAIDEVAAVIAHQQRAVGRDHGADGSAPSVAVVGDESNHEVVVLTGRY